jgi:predicted transcriptional regulator
MPRWPEPEPGRDDEIVRLAQEERWTNRRIAKHFDMTTARVSQILQERGVPNATRADQAAARQERIAAKLVRMANPKHNQHGTTTAYQWHLEHNSTPCAACKAAWATYHRGYYQRRLSLRNNKKEQ